MLAAPTLGPLSEEVAFSTTGAAEQCVQHLTGEMWIVDCATVPIEEAVQRAVKGLWKAFDEQVA